MKKPVGALIALTLGVGAALGLGVSSASAHVPSISASCAGVVVSGTQYDAAKVNHWTVTVGGVPTSGTFGASFTQTIPVPQDGATTYWTAIVEDQDNTPKYTEALSGNVGPCGTAPLPDPVWPIASHTCDTFTLGALTDYEKYPLKSNGVDRWTAGVANPLVGTVSVTAHTLASDTTHKQGSHTYTFTASECPTAPPTPTSQACTVTGAASFEAPDHFAVKGASGWQFTNQPLVAGAPAGSTPDGHPVDLIFPSSGNLQGFTSLTYTDKNVIGNGIFFRFILDLSADGGSAYNSFSVTSNTVNQASVANVGSKATLLGKTVAQVAALYPHNQIKAIAFETGSTYLSGDGALLTGVSGACLNASFVNVPNQPTPPSGIGTGDVPVSPLLPAGVLLLAASVVFAFRKPLARKF